MLILLAFISLTITDVAAQHCPNAYEHEANVVAMNMLLDLEREYKIPPVLHGITLAAWCIESGYSPDGVDIWRNIAIPRLGAGPFQIHQYPWVKKCKLGKDGRMDLEKSARCYLSQVVRLRDKGVKYYGLKGDRAWIVAEAMWSGGQGRYSWTRYSKSSHYRLLKIWRTML